MNTKKMFDLNKKCILVINGENQRLTFEGEIQAYDGNFIRFLDKFGLIYIYHTSKIIYVKEWRKDGGNS